MANPNPSWTTLLAGWTDFARSASALPEEGGGGRWKRSVAPAIALHAVSMALAELITIDPEERPLAMDRAEMTIREHAAALNEVWRAEPMPESLTELIDDARLAWEAALHEGAEWTVESDTFLAVHPVELAEKLLDAGFVGEVMVPAPGVPLFKTSACATARERDGGPPDDEICSIIREYLLKGEGRASKRPMVCLPLRQVYRQFDFARAGPVRDLLAPVVGADLPAGQPLLVPVVSGGDACTIPPPRAPQRMTPIPVETLGEIGPGTG